MSCAPNNTSLAGLRSVVYSRAPVNITLFALYVEIMPDEQAGQRVNLNISSETRNDLRPEVFAHGDDVMSRPRVFERRKRLREGREEMGH